MKFDVEDYVSTNLVRAKPVQSGNGSEMTATCPACERYGGFYINTETGAYLCNKCSFRSKTVVGLVAQVEGIDWGEARALIFKRSVKLRRKQDIFSLADRIRSLRPDAIEDDEPEDVQVGLPDFYVPIFDPKRDPKWRLPRYIRGKGGRAIKSKTCAAWGLGYCRKGRYSDRLIIPIDCPAGVSWTARAMSADAWGPKYMNPDGADHRRLLIGWHVARVTGDIVLCEGPLDAVKLWQHDVSALALGGKELHDEQLGMLMTIPPTAAVTILLDPEERVAPFDLASRLSVHFEYIYIATLPSHLPDGEKCDPGNASRKIAHKAIDEARLWRSSRSARTRAILERSRRKLDKIL